MGQGVKGISVARFKMKTQHKFCPYMEISFFFFFFFLFVCLFFVFFLTFSAVYLIGHPHGVQEK